MRQKYLTERFEIVIDPKLKSNLFVIAEAEGKSAAEKVRELIAKEAERTNKDES